MDLLETLRRMFAYDEWANREVMLSLRAAGQPPKRAMQTMAHIIAAERLWLARIERDDEPVVVWPDFCVDETERQIAAACAAWCEYLGTLTADRLRARVVYLNSKGEHWSSTIADILMHVVMHSAYHRGQIARELRREGHTPAYTDFIEATRREHI